MTGNRIHQDGSKLSGDIPVIDCIVWFSGSGPTDDSPPLLHISARDMKVEIRMSPADALSAMAWLMCWARNNGYFPEENSNGPQAT